MRFPLKGLGIVLACGVMVACGSAVQSFRVPDFNDRFSGTRVHVRLKTGTGAISVQGTSVAGIRATQIMPGGEQAVVAAQRIAFELLSMGFTVTASPSDAAMYADFTIATVRYDALTGWIADEALLEFVDTNTGDLLASYRASGRFITPTVNNLVSNLIDDVRSNQSETQRVAREGTPRNLTRPRNDVGTGSVPGAAKDVRPPESTAGTGTAFVVDPDGLLLTAQHVVDQATSITVSCNGRPAVPVTVTSSSPSVDLAVLTAESSLGTNAFLRLSHQQPRLGDEVFTVGYPTPSLLGRDPKYTNGTVSALSGIGGDASFMQISVPVQPGNSGGPLVNQNGEVIGVVVATADAPAFLRATDSIPQNINWAVKSVFASALFTPPAANAGSDVAPADVIAHVTDATCLVEATGAAQ
jgi:S1-C subfamily serine protease